MAESACVVGIDVAKAQLDGHVRPQGETWRVANDPAGIADLTAHLCDRRPTLIVLEATGGLALLVAASLAAAALAVVIVTPRQVRAFARAIGQLATTDVLEAALLAPFADVVRPPVRPLPDAAAQSLAALVARRRQLVAMRTAAQQRLGTAVPAVRSHVARQLAWLAEELTAVDHELAQLIAASPTWQGQTTLLQSVPGVGPVIATTLIADVPELGRLDRKAIATLVGVAPLTCERGTWRGRRMIWGGRAQVRAALSMGTVVAVQHHPVLQSFDDRLLAAGKPKKVALTACMHKLLLILNAILRQQEPWHAPIPATPPA